MYRRYMGILALLALAGCAATGSLIRSTPTGAEAIYRQAAEDLEDSLYPEALKGFGELKNKYPYSALAALADLRIADTHFRRGKLSEAVDAYRSFLKYHPNHAQAPYAMYQIGEAYYDQLPGDWWFLPPPSEKDQGKTRLAISGFRDMLNRYRTHDLSYAEAVSKKEPAQITPDELYIAGIYFGESPKDAFEVLEERFPTLELTKVARERLDACRGRLAAHELYVANFYFARDKFRAAAGRAEGLLRDYPGLGFDEEALWIAGKSRYETGEEDAARASLSRLAKEFPESAWASDAATLLEDMPPAVEG